MTLTELRYIIAVARLRHFGRAAEACHVSQPTLSVAIRKLEDELGISLFERTSTEVKPTPVGERIIEQAQRVIDEAEQLLALARQGADPLAEPLRLGIIYTIGPYLLPRLIPRMHHAAPQMPLLIEENYTSVLRERLRHGELDAIVIALPFSEANVVTLPVYDEPFTVAIPASHKWTRQKFIDGEQLGDETVVLLGAGHCFRDQILQAFPDLAQRLSGGRIQQMLEGSSLETIRHMVASGAGITVLPCSATQGADNELLCYRPFRPPVPSRRIALAWRKSFPRPQAIEAIRQSILDCDIACLKPVRGRAGRAR